MDIFRAALIPLTEILGKNKQLKEDSLQKSGGSNFCLAICYFDSEGKDNGPAEKKSYLIV